MGYYMDIIEADLKTLDVKAAHEAQDYFETYEEADGLLDIEYDSYKYTDCFKDALKALATHLIDDSYIIFNGEDGWSCRYSFEGGKVFIENAKIEWVNKEELK